jgi:hypothetical protein
MVGIGCPSAADSVDGGPRQPNDRSSTRPCPQSFFKRKKNLLILFAPSSPPHRLAAATSSVLSRTRMPLYLAAVACPIRRCSLALVMSASHPLPSCAHSARRMCRPPGQAKSGAGGAGARAPLVA